MTDREKSAYLPTSAQRTAIEAAGFKPALDGTAEQLLTLEVLLDSMADVVTASYYLSKRSAAAGRKPEPRMGRQLISEWLRPGDDLLIGNIGVRIFALKTSTFSDNDAGAAKIAGALPFDILNARALAASGPAPRRRAVRSEFIRNPYVVAGALLRAGGRCEVLGCSRELFKRHDGDVFLEVHHLVPLAMNGLDELSNVAALCPSCHREMHYGSAGAELTAAVQAHLALVDVTGGLS